MSKATSSCNCVETVDAMLAERNTRLVQALTVRPLRSRLMIATEVIEKKRGARAVGMFPTYCPFCGVAYDPSKPAETAEVA